MSTGLIVLYFIIGLIAAGLFKIHSPPVGEEDYALIALAFFFWPLFLLMGFFWAIGRLLSFIIDIRG